MDKTINGFLERNLPEYKKYAKPETTDAIPSAKKYIKKWSI